MCVCRAELFRDDLYQISLDERVAKIHSAACLWTEYKKRVATRILEKNHHDGERKRLPISYDKDRDSMSTCVLLTLTTRIRKKTIAYTDRHVELSQGTAYAKSFYASVYVCLYCAPAIVRELPHNTMQVLDRKHLGNVFHSV